MYQGPSTFQIDIRCADCGAMVHTYSHTPLDGDLFDRAEMKAALLQRLPHTCQEEKRPLLTRLWKRAIGAGP